MGEPNLSVSADLVRHLLEGARASGAQQRFHLERAGISSGLLGTTQARVTQGQFAALYRGLAAELEDESPGMFSRPLHPGTLKFLTLSLLDARSLLVALHRIAQFFSLVLDDLQLEVVTTDQRTRVMLEPRAASLEGHHFAQEMMLRLIHGMTCWLACRRLPIDRLDLAYPAPAYAADYPSLYPGPAHFDQPTTAIHFDNRLLEEPVRQTNLSVRRFLARAPADWLFMSGAERTASQRVRSHLLGGLEGNAGIEQVAHALAMSTRTLARVLEAEGTSFQLLKDELRRDRATHMLMHTTLSAEIISARIGFRSAATFSRAFKRWTGYAPGAYRQRDMQTRGDWCEAPEETRWRTVGVEPFARLATELAVSD